MQIWHYVAACSPMKKLQRQESNCSASIIIASPFMAGRCGMHCICTACTIHISRTSTVYSTGGVVKTPLWRRAIGVHWHLSGVELNLVVLVALVVLPTVPHQSPNRSFQA